MELLTNTDIKYEITKIEKFILKIEILDLWKYERLLTKEVQKYGYSQKYIETRSIGYLNH